MEDHYFGILPGCLENFCFFLALPLTRRGVVFLSWHAHTGGGLFTPPSVGVGVGVSPPLFLLWPLFGGGGGGGGGGIGGEMSIEAVFGGLGGPGRGFSLAVSRLLRFYFFGLTIRSDVILLKNRIIRLLRLFR